MTDPVKLDPQVEELKAFVAELTLQNESLQKQVESSSVRPDFAFTSDQKLRFDYLLKTSGMDSQQQDKFVAALLSILNEK